MTRWRPRPSAVEDWIPWVRILAAPYALVDAALESFPPSHQPWSWVLAGTFAAGAIALFLARDTHPAVGLAFDLALVSGFVCF